MSSPDRNRRDTARAAQQQEETLRAKAKRQRDEDALPALPGGRAKEKRNRNLVATRLSRWAEGERAALWEEVREERGERPGRRGPAPGERRKREKGDQRDKGKGKMGEGKK